MSEIGELLAQVAERRAHKPRNKREQNRQEARQRLLDAWRDLYASGEAQTPIGELAKKADVSVGTFYALFEDRGDLTKDAALDSIARMIEGIEDLAVERGDDAYARVRASLSIVVGFAERYPREMLFLYRLTSGGSPEGNAFKEMWYAFWDAFAEDEITAEYAHAGLTPPFNLDVAVRASRGMAMEALGWWLTADDPIPREVLVDSLARLMHSAIAPQTPQTTRED